MLTTPARAERTANNCDDLVKNLLSCTPYTCIRLSLEKNLQTITHHILGPSKQDKSLCLVTETMPQHKMFSCSYDQATRQAAARMLANSLNNINEIDKNDQAIMLEAWNQGYCNIQDQPR